VPEPELEPPAISKLLIRSNSESGSDSTSISQAKIVERVERKELPPLPEKRE